MAIDRQTIQEHELLRQLPPSVAEAICQQASLKTIPAETMLFDCGSACDALPLVLHGSIRVFKQSGMGREISLYRVNKDQLCLITLSCLLGEDAYPATGVTESDVVTILLPRSLFFYLIETQPLFRQAAFHLFAERLSSLMQLVDEITFRKLDQRIAQLLVRRGPVIEESHQQLADELGSVREIVSRILKQFEESGWIKLARRQIEVVNLNALENYSSEVK